MEREPKRGEPAAVVFRRSTSIIVVALNYYTGNTRTTRHGARSRVIGFGRRIITTSCEKTNELLEWLKLKRPRSKDLR